MNVNVNINDIVSANEDRKSPLNNKSSNSLYKKKEEMNKSVTVLALPSNTPSQRRDSISMPPIVSHKAGPSNVFGETSKIATAEPRVLQLKTTTEPRLSSTFDELNISAWDFLTVDLDLVNDSKQTVPSPKRKIIKNTTKSPIKKLKSSNSPKKSPVKMHSLQFKFVSNYKAESISRNLNTRLDEPDTLTLNGMKGPREMECGTVEDINEGKKSKTLSSSKRLAGKASSLDSPHKQRKGYSIIDVTGNLQLFQTFLEEWNGKTQYALAVAWQLSPKPEHSTKRTLSFCENLTDRNMTSKLAKPVGVAVCWGEMDCYYINLKDDSLIANIDNISTATPQVATGMLLFEKYV